MCRGSRVLAIAAIAVLVVFGTGCDRPASEQSGPAYRYEDDHGVVHYTDNPGTVPERFRGRLKRVEREPNPSQTRVKVHKRERGWGERLLIWLGMVEDPEAGAEDDAPARRPDAGRSSGPEVRSGEDKGWFDREGDARFRDNGEGGGDAAGVAASSRPHDGRSDGNVRTYEDAQGRTHYRRE